MMGVDVAPIENLINSPKSNLMALAWLDVHEMEGFIIVNKKLWPFLVDCDSTSLLHIL